MPLSNSSRGTPTGAAGAGCSVKAITFQGRASVLFDTVPEPRVEQPTDAIVEVRAAGICGSDMHPYHERERGLDHGTVMGHEFVGEVVAVGGDVTVTNVGDLVCSPFTTSCGTCFYCERGLTSRCSSGQLFGWVENGTGLQGSQAEYVRVPLADGTLMRVPEGVSAEAALLMGDILSTGFFCAEGAGIGKLDADGKVEPGRSGEEASTYVVVGCGPVGLMTTIAALELGAEELFVVDAIPERLVVAERLGGIPLNYEEDSVVEIILEATDGRGAEAVMEVVGARAATELAISLLRPGGVLSSVGVHTDERFGFTPVAAYDKNLTFRSGRCPARYYMDRLARVARLHNDALEPVFSHKLPLSDGVRGYEIFDKKLDGCTKVLLEPHQGPTAAC